MKMRWNNNFKRLIIRLMERVKESFFRSFLLTGASGRADGGKIMKHPNLLFVFSDQHRKFDIGCYGNQEVMTPNLDRLAEEGMRFEHCCSNSPVCVPARGSILTGLYAQKHGAFTNDLAICYDVESIADVLNQAGYHTGYIGKWHLCGVPRDQYIDKDRRLGFTEWKVANCNHDYLNCYYDDEENVRHSVEGYEPEIFGELAADFLERNADKEEPFALFVSFASPHDPHDRVGEEYKKIYEGRPVSLRPNAPEKIMVNTWTDIDKERQTELMGGYYGHVTAIDRQVGRLMDILERRGKKDDTLIVYTSDHGDMLGSQGTRDKQLPYEESIGVPLLMSMKNVIEPGVQKGMIGLVDLPVTIAGLLGLSFKHKTDGKDLQGMILRGENGQEECYLYDLYPCHQAADKGMKAWRAIRSQRYTYAVFGDGTEWLLFDNEADPYQMNNLISDPSMEEVRNELAARLRRYVETYDGFMDGDEYIYYSGRLKDFNQSQEYFQRPVLKQK